MKNLIYSLAALCMLLFAYSSASAQFNSPFNRPFNTPFNGMPPIRVPPNRNMHVITIRESGFYHVAGGGISYRFEVEMKNGKKLKVSSPIYTDTVRKATYLIVPRDYGLPNAYKDPEKRIYCRETKSIGSGIATDSCWLFKVIEGKINAYGPLPDVDVNECLFAIQAGDGPIKQFTVQALEEMIKDDADAWKYLKKKKFSDAIGTYNYNQKRKQEEEEYAEATKGY
ncbi:hypothetical protein KHS38_16075 [Mucilaginibacter sp. Bleaf8]|uniref:hypothetical protein n=1 Tax=Mucilaginibacter sp. Bleaf8 TaxID=2834430 RepID=UPI001BD17F2B|nr:hypothetical protein [Mucilaginibacter sp. Bleaf8]MBS7565926.1 hypothetical protein [Mucilaginibacter sp. Bleaf8]